MTPIADPRDILLLRTAGPLLLLPRDPETRNRHHIVTARTLDMATRNAAGELNPHTVTAASRITPP